MPVLRKPRHEAFAQGLAKGMSEIDAYTKAGYKPSPGSASRLSRKGNIRERVLELISLALEENEVTVQRVLAEMARMAFYNPVDVIKVLGGKLGDLTKLQSLPEDLQRCIKKITPVKLGDEIHYRVEFADKEHMLDSLARHLQMFKGTVVVENVFKILQEMPDDELNRRIAELEISIRESTGLDAPPGEGSETLH